MSEDFSSYRLAKWSRIIRIRDKSVCYVCSEKPDERRHMQAHHCYPKAIFPEKAYELNNGVTVCTLCHMSRCHSTDDAWKKFIPMFRRYLKSASARRFNEKYQKRVTPDAG